MIERKLTALIREAIAAAGLGADSAGIEIELDRPRQREFGDFTTNVAMALASKAGSSGAKPRDIATAIVAAIPANDLIARTDIAGPGFINFHVSHGWLHDALREVAARGDRYGVADSTGQRIQVEYVSANPVGPLHIGTARNAVLGDALANLLVAAGDQVEREYYFNDAGRQMDLFGASVETRYLEHFDREAELPEDGY
jgi:arginyl-tRNA synthetase